MTCQLRLGRTRSLRDWPGNPQDRRPEPKTGGRQHLSTGRGLNELRARAPSPGPNAIGDMAGVSSMQEASAPEPTHRWVAAVSDGAGGIARPRAPFSAWGEGFAATQLLVIDFTISGIPCSCQGSWVPTSTPSGVAGGWIGNPEAWVRVAPGLLRLALGQGDRPGRARYPWRHQHRD